MARRKAAKRKPTKVVARVTSPDKETGQTGAGWENARFEAALWSFGLLQQYKDDVYVNNYTALTYSVLWACVRYISQTIAGLGWHVFESIPGKPGKERVYDDISWLLDTQASPEMDAFNFRQVLVKDALTWGNGYAEITRDGFHRPRWLWYISPDRVCLERTDSGELYYEIDNGVGEQATSLTPDRVFHLKGLGPDGLVGYSVIALARRAIKLGLQTEKYGDTYFGRGPMPGGILKIPGNVKKEERDSMRQSFQETYGGSKNAGKVVAVSGGIEFDPLSLPNEDAQFIESRKFQVNEICRWFGVPPHKVFDLERATFCLPAGETVLTEDGPRPIESVATGDRVWSRGDNGLTLATVSRAGCTGTDPILTIRTTNRTIRCNAKHPILCRRQRLAEKSGATIGGVYRDGKLHSVQWVTEFVPAGELRPGDTVVTLDHLPDMGSYEACRTRLPTIGFMEFCGLLLGDGNVIRSDKSAYVTIARARHAAYMDYYREVIRAEFRGAKGDPVRLQEGERQTRFSSTAAVEELTVLGFTGNARTKRVPGWVFRLPESHRLAFIRGFLDADGSCDKKGRLSFSSCGGALLGQIRDLCIGCGIPVTNMRLQRGTTTLPNGERKEFAQYTFTCSNPGANRRVGSRTPAYVARMESGQPFGRKGRAYPRYGGCSFAEANLSLARIASIEVGQSEPVYDLTVEGTHSFIAEGVVVHNSNIEHQSIEAVQDCHLPWCRRLETEADIKLFGRVMRGRRWTRLNLNTLLRGDSATQTANLVSQVNTGLVTPDEAREHLDYNPYPDGLGEQPIVQGAMKPLKLALEPPEPPQPAAPPGQDGAKPPQQDGEPPQDRAMPEQFSAVFGRLLEDAYGRLLRVESDKAKRAENKGELLSWAAGYFNRESEMRVADQIRPIIEAAGVYAGKPLEWAGPMASRLAANHNATSLANPDPAALANGRADEQAKAHLRSLWEALWTSA